jgi:hypothetical protein
MSGIAVIIPGADFSAKNLGQVTFLADEDVTAITISGDATFTGMRTQYTAAYLPATTNQRGVTWSVVTGGEYATISNDGVLTVLQGANAAAVTIRATSIYDQTVTAQKTVTVTYSAEVALTGIAISGPSEVSGASQQYAAVLTPNDTTQTGVTWSVSDNTKATIDNTGLLTILSGANASQVTVTATSTANSSIVATKQVTLTYVEPKDYWNLKGNVGKVPLPASQLSGKKIYLHLQLKDAVYSGRYNNDQIILENGGGMMLVCYSSGNPYKSWDVKIQAKKLRSSQSTGGSKIQVSFNGVNYIRYFFDGTADQGSVASGTLSAQNDFIGIGIEDSSLLSSYITNQALQSAVTNNTIVPGVDQDIKIRRLAIVLSSTEYSTVDEAMEVETPIVDIQVGQDGNPYNAGTTGDLLFTNFD